jgi:hypothetical protein
MDTRTLLWIKSVLANDDNSADEELVEYFVQEGPMTRREAEAWIAKRSFYANNLVQHDAEGNDVGVYDPKTRSIKPLA